VTSVFPTLMLPSDDMNMTIDAANASATPPADRVPMNAASAASSWRILLLINCFRLLVPLVLGTLIVTVHPTPLGASFPALFVATLFAYWLFAIACLVSIKRRWPGVMMQAVAHVLIDIVAIAALTYASGGMSSGLAALMVLPVTGASLIVVPRLGLLLAATATIALLFQQGVNIFRGVSDAGEITAAGLVGALIFCLSLGAGYAAKRLQESEAELKQREVDLANLAELNEFIVQHLRESILVVDAQDRVRLINESAAQLLKNGPVSTNTLLGEISPRLLYLLDTWRRQSDEPQQNITVTLVSADGGTLVQPHFVALAKQNPGPTLVFLEDTSLITERIQQSKLAALGRLSASIAHEIRNPVGAMSHAAQLLSESPNLASQDQRLTRIMTDNAARVSTIINNILQLSRRDATHAERLSLNNWIEEFREQFQQSFQLQPDQLALISPGYAVDVRADPSHLHQILWNLCENALKYGRSSATELIELRYGRISNTNRPYLEIADRGTGIPADEAERIFEPFFTAGEGGTGLGLFIARELATCNRAVLIYEPRHGGGSVFRIVFSDPQRWEI
jgi:two-component system, NtrC family, sensor histidine kinase PilS